MASSSPSESTSNATTTTRKGGVASPQELRDFVSAAGSRLLVLDVRNPDPEVEPGDQKSIAVAPLAAAAAGSTNQNYSGSGMTSHPPYRPKAQNLIFDRKTNSMPLPDVPLDTPIITHCGGGGRGQKAKDYLMSNGFTTVINGGGPKETECWNEFGDQ